MKYLIPPKEVSFKQILSKHKLSGLAYYSVMKKNKDLIPIKDLIHEPIKGIEPGEKSYVENSDYYFIKNRAIRRYSYIPTGHTIYLSEGGQTGIIPIKPSSFVDLDLRKEDILYTKDTTLGESAMIESNDYKNFMFSSGLLKLRVKENPYYVFGFLKNEYLRDQINALTIKGSILSHSGDNVLSCEIPFPKDNSVIKDVENIVRKLVRIEFLIRKKHEKAIEIVKNEIDNGNKKSKFHFSYPTFNEIRERKRLDAALYDIKYKNFVFKLNNYKNGKSTIENMGYKVKRGQNLQISAIGNSIYSNHYRKNYFRLIRPRDISSFGTIDKIEFLGNANDLDLIRDGDVMFGSEGTYRPTAFFEMSDKKAITNIHGMIIYKDPPSNEDSAFICAYIWYLAKEGILSVLSVGAHGGSVTKDYVLKLPIPNFPKSTKIQLESCYYNNTSNLENLGISQLDFKKLELTQELDITLNEIIYNRV